MYFPLLYKAFAIYTNFFNKFKTCPIHWDQKHKKLYFNNSDVTPNKTYFANFVMRSFPLITMAYLRYPDYFWLVKPHTFDALLLMAQVNISLVSLTFEWIVSKYGQSLIVCWNYIHQAELTSKIGNSLIFPWIDKK